MPLELKGPARNKADATVSQSIIGLKHSASVFGLLSFIHTAGSGAITLFVITGLDPVIHGKRRRDGTKLDYRVKPGNDEKRKP